MPTNDFVTIAAGNGANTLTVAQYQASGKLALGWQDGIVDGPTFNTMWRQLSTITTMIAQFTADNQGSNVQDNGNVATLEAQFGAALLAYVEREGIVWCVDTGTADALTANPLPVLTSYAAGQVVAILKNPQVGANATATPSINISSLGAKTITKGSGMQLAAGDLVAGALTLAVYDGSQFRHIGAALSTTDLRVQAGQAVVFQTSGTNAYTGSLIPAPASLTPRMELLGAFGNANTSSSAPTLQLNGLGSALPILKQGGGVPQPGDISGFVPLILNAAGSAWLINGLTTSDVIALSAQAPTGKGLWSQAYRGTYSFTVPAGVYWLYATCVGAGGGASGNSTSGTTGGAGGGAGGTAQGWIQVTPGQVITCVVGAGGGGAGYQAAGGNGGSSTIGSTFTGGGGGGAGGNPPAGGPGGVGSGGQVNLYGGNGGDGAGTGAASGGQGGASSLGGGGRASTINSVQTNGRAPGSGAGGLYSQAQNASGGTGADGYVSLQY